MCVAAIAWQAHPRWPLVAIGNRDEYHARAAEPLHKWDNGILAGRDLAGGGTWLGVAEGGRFALVTNLRGYGDREPHRASRGELVTDMLRAKGAYADPAPSQLAAFNPFNLIFADGVRMEFLSNRPEPVRTALAHGIYGLSNSRLDEPWPKTLQLKAALLDWVNAELDDVEPLFTALRSESLEAIGLHPRKPSDVPAEPPETPPFIRDPVYGTRCSTIVTVDANGRGMMAERRFDPHGARTGDTDVAFSWAPQTGAIAPLAPTVSYR